MLAAHFRASSAKTISSSFVIFDDFNQIRALLLASNSTGKVINVNAIFNDLRNADKIKYKSESYVI